MIQSVSVLVLLAAVQSLGQKALPPQPISPKNAVFIPPLTVGIDICAECQDAVGLLKKAVDDPSYLPEVEKILDPLCDDLPGAIARWSCHETIKHLDLLINDLKPLLNDPHEVCSELRLCNSGAAQDLFRQLAQMQQRPRVADKPFCSECKDAVTDLKTNLDDPKLRTSVTDSLNKLCTQFSYLSSACKDAVSTYLPEAFDYVDKLLADPTKICAAVDLC